MHLSGIWILQSTNKSGSNPVDVSSDSTKDSLNLKISNMPDESNKRIPGSLFINYP